MKITYDESRAADYLSAIAVIVLVIALLSGYWLNLNDVGTAASTLLFSVGHLSLLWLLPIAAVMGLIATGMLLRRRARGRAVLLLLAAGVVALIYYVVFFAMNSGTPDFVLLGIDAAGVSGAGFITDMGLGFWIALYAALVITVIGIVLQVVGVDLTDLTAPGWRSEVYTSEIDAMLANLALNTEKPEVAEAAARAIGRIRSEAAVRVLAESQRKGEGGALRALALVRDEAPSLPRSVSRQGRLYAWLDNTRRRLTDAPLHAVWRYIFAAILSGIAVWWYAYSEISDASIFFAERWGKSLTTGITFGVVFGLVILLAAEVPERLRGFWPWWARLLLNLILGLATGILVWVVFAWFFLYYQPAPEDFNAIIVGGFGAAMAFALGVTFRVPGWLAAIWAALMIYIPLYVTWSNYMPPLIYVRPGEDISQYGIPIAVLIAIGAYLPMLVGDLRKLIGRVRRTVRPQAQPATALS